MSGEEIILEGGNVSYDEFLHEFQNSEERKKHSVFFHCCTISGCISAKYVNILKHVVEPKRYVSA